MYKDIDCGKEVDSIDPVMNNPIPGKGLLEMEEG
jgi:hypothetical protein